MIFYVKAKKQITFSSQTILMSHVNTKKYEMSSLLILPKNQDRNYRAASTGNKRGSEKISNITWQLLKDHIVKLSSSVVMKLNDTPFLPNLPLLPVW
ncbi:unnamed protein product [Brassica rapa]|uniref:Uncharacterized protein n=1 Tax=Brassica campestris TaxID=3711 RepID=A0A8D9GW11_BRACM|nr:unnamed protein product [Brassica rapa]